MAHAAWAEAHPTRWLLALLLVALVACGGSGSATSDPPAPGSATGSLSLGLVGTSVEGVSHVWVTVDALALHTDPHRAWSPTDTSWQVIRLASPRTIDLAATTNGVIAPLVTGHTLTAASYGQMRLFALRHDEPLVDAARQLGLTRNAQVEQVDVDGIAHTVPLELTDAGLGLRVAGPIDIAAGVSNDITLQWDLAHSLVRFASDDGLDRLSLRPDLRAYDLAKTGAIVGLLDKSLFCTTAPQTGCIRDAVASALLPSADGRFKRSVRSTPVVLGSEHALFALYPLPALAAGETFDVVIRGRDMQTMVVRGVPASAADLLAARPTQLGTNPADPSHPVPLVPALSLPGDGHVTLDASTTPPSAQLLFGQTLPGSGELPLELAAANTDPFTGRLARPVALPGGPLRVASYTADAVLAFADVAPQEGAEHFSVMPLGTRYDDTVSLGSVAVPGGSTVAMTAPVTWRKPSLGVASVEVHLSGGAGFDAAQLVVSDVGGIVATVDVSGLLNAQAAVQLPAGANAAALGGTAVYSIAVRAWKRSAPLTSVTWARAASVVDLRGGAPASVSISVPAAP
ncbi:MAG TPA: DUF4382 domain-containing protein [Albitalea sp.]|uniref:DUF4382 domain-containing protein n=1 Tax=Piscinibacter sp. TaxID=1903157 RepID=UPI002ED128D2